MQTKKQKHKFLRLMIPLFIGFVCLSLLPHLAYAEGPFQYHLLEDFPGFYAKNTIMNDLPNLMLSLYKFGIWTISIAGLFMITIGGFMYMSSAGNTATASSAKGIIQDAIIGIIAAMCAYLILYVINPDLTNIDILFTPATLTSTLRIFCYGA